MVMPYAPFIEVCEKLNAVAPISGEKKTALVTTGAEAEASITAGFAAPATDETGALLRPAPASRPASALVQLAGFVAELVTAPAPATAAPSVFLRMYSRAPMAATAASPIIVLRSIFYIQ